ncbi:MAG: hypothetical protein ACI835_005818 [Planctomycetota bacterium]|jgi:uncharacterized protein
MTLASPLQPPGATPASKRFVSMDVLRGFALFGIFVVNLPYLARLKNRASHPTGESGLDLAAWSLVTRLCQTKFFALFSTLFGMGLVLQMKRAEASGRQFERMYLRRLGLLSVMGLLHGVFLFFSDTLFVYSIAGLILFFARKSSPRTDLTLPRIRRHIHTKAVVGPHAATHRIGQEDARRVASGPIQVARDRRRQHAQPFGRMLGRVISSA